MASGSSERRQERALRTGFLAMIGAGGTCARPTPSLARPHRRELTSLKTLGVRQTLDGRGGETALQSEAVVAQTLGRNRPHRCGHVGWGQMVAGGHSGGWRGGGRLSMEIMIGTAINSSVHSDSTLTTQPKPSSNVMSGLAGSRASARARLGSCTRLARMWAASPSTPRLLR